MAGHSGTSLSVAHLLTLPSRPARARTFPAGTVETGCSAAPIIINNATLPPPRSRRASSSISESSVFPPHVGPGRRVKCCFDAGGFPAVGPASRAGEIQSSPRGDECLHAPGFRGWYFGPRTCRGQREKDAGKSAHYIIGKPELDDGLKKRRNWRREMVVEKKVNRIIGNPEPDGRQN